MDKNKDNVTFVAQFNAPDINSTDYWVDLKENKHGGIIKYFDKDQCDWTVIQYDTKIIDELQAWLSCALSALEKELYRQVDILTKLINDLRSYTEQNIKRLDNRIDELKKYVDENINKLKQEFNTKIDNLQKQIDAHTEQINNIQNKVNSIENNLTTVIGQLDDHAKRRDNPHVVTRAQLGLATTDSVSFSRVSAPNGFFKE